MMVAQHFTGPENLSLDENHNENKTIYTIVLNGFVFKQAQR